MSFSVGGVDYEVRVDDSGQVVVNANGVTEVMISQYYSASGNVVIPASVISESVTYAVTSVKPWCPWGSVTSITFPEGFTTLSNYSVHDVQSLTSVTFPSTITSFGDYNFNHAINLKNITFAEGITTLSNYLFNDCTGLKRITFPASLTTIGPYIFQGCTSLKTVTFLGDLPSKQYGEFNNIAAGAVGYYNPSKTGWGSGGTGIIANLPMLPESARPVYPNIEVDCNVPTKTVNGSSTIINFEFEPLTGGAVTEYKLFNSTNTGTPLTLSSSTSTSISYSITTLAIDTTMSFYVVAYNGSDAVSPLQSIHISVDIDGTLPKSYNLDSLSYNLNSRNLTATISGCSASGNVVIPATLAVDSYTFNVTSVKDWCPWGSVTSITFPEGFTTLATCSVHDVQSLISVTFPSTITSFGDNNFEHAINLKNITFAEGITTLSNTLFKDCTGLESITFPASLTTIGSNLCSGCTSLNSVTFLGNIPSKQNGEFNNIAAGAVGYYNSSKTGWGSGGTGIIENLNMQAGSGSGGNAAVPVAPVVVPVAPTAPGSSPVACLPTGQRILTASGWRAVETLRHGDMVITDKGTAVPATIYSSTIKTTVATAPITIPANLFGRNAPAAPIRLSPMHAVRMTKNVWEFPYNLLRSRDGVTQDAPGASVTYYHVALPNFLRDNMVLEGGVIAESFGAPFAKANGIQGTKMYTYSERLGGYTRIGEGSIKKTA